MQDLHRIEKGLSLKNSKQNFGKAVIFRLAKCTSQYVQNLGFSDPTALSAADALQSYLEIHKGFLDREIESQIKKTLAICNSRSESIQYIDKNEIINSARIHEKFFTSRHSVRSFTDEPISDDQIKKAVILAINTPSVCNRQSWRVHILRNERKNMALSHQNGNRGFRDQIHTALLVCVDLRSFSSINERNQGWIDGGMFAMSVIYALHSLGVGTCCLNLCLTKAKEFLFRKDLSLPPYELPIMMIAVGHIPDHLCVTKSMRYPIDHIIQ